MECTALVMQFAKGSETKQKMMHPVFRFCSVFWFEWDLQAQWEWIHASVEWAFNAERILSNLAAGKLTEDKMMKLA